MGIEQPKSVDEQLKIQADVSAMRKAITLGQRDSALINRCLRIAECNGLSGEEAYVLLAYHALIQLNGLWERQLKLSMLDLRGHAMNGPSDSALGAPNDG